MYNATVGALVKETTEIEHTPRKAAEPEEEEEYPTRAAVRRFLAADVVEQAGLVRQMRSDGESEAAIEREETLLRELRAKLREAEPSPTRRSDDDAALLACCGRQCTCDAGRQAAARGGVWRGYL